MAESGTVCVPESQASHLGIPQDPATEQELGQGGDLSPVALSFVLSYLMSQGMGEFWNRAGEARTKIARVRECQGKGEIST
jgi:hypothetical protein